MKRKRKVLVEQEVEDCDRCKTTQAVCFGEFVLYPLDNPEAPTTSFVRTKRAYCGRCRDLLLRNAREMPKKDRGDKKPEDAKGDQANAEAATATGDQLPLPG